MPYRVGISGLRRGMSLARVFPLVDGAVVAGCDPDPAARAAFVNQFPQAASFPEFDAMLGTALDIVVVASPVPQHVAQTVAALGAGCHVLQEVCLADTVDGCRAILDAVLGHPRQKFMLAENCCYWGHIMAWRKLVADGQIGDLIHAEAEYIHDCRALMQRDGHPTWRMGLAPLHYSTHSLGPLLKITRARCATAVGLATASRLDPGPERWDMEVGLFQTTSGATIKVLCGFRVQREPAFHFYSLYGSRGCLETTRPPAAPSTHAYLASVPHLQGMIQMPLGTDVPRAPAGAAVGGHGTAEFYMVQEFVEAIRHDRVPELDVYAALDMSLPGLCAHQSALQGGTPVPIPDWR
jgi:predicted dehydrogenase